MGLRQRLSEWIRIAKDIFDFGPEFPAALAAHRLEFAEELSKLPYLREQAQQASQEKDELIAKLQAAGAVEGDMVVDGPAYFVRKPNRLDGPFCTSCFQQNHEASRIVAAPRPKEADGSSTAWVQCAKCRTPFPSERIGGYLNPRGTVPTEPAGSPERNDGAKSAPAARKPGPQDRRSKDRPGEGTRVAVRPRPARS